MTSSRAHKIIDHVVAELKTTRIGISKATCDDLAARLETALELERVEGEAETMNGDRQPT